MNKYDNQSRVLIELKACPFCGNDYGIHIEKDEKSDLLYVHCYHCNAKGSKNKEKEKCILEWNYLKR
jgi:Lar family restriction alleviation protein